MPKHLSKHPKLLIISDTGLYLNDDQWFGFGPVVNEVYHFLSFFEHVTWIGFNRLDKKNNRAYKKLTSKEVNVIALKRVGGNSILNKLDIIFNYPKMWSVINAEVKQHKYIHVRAPSNPAIIAMQLSKKYSAKTFWFKYAGSWVDKASKSYHWQREQLRQLKSNAVISVNGNWPDSHAQILNLDNPCLNEDDRYLGAETVKSKNFVSKYNLCFVGGLNTNKGIINLIEALKIIDKTLLNDIHIIGDGPLRKKAEALSKGLNINFYGAISKKEVIALYKKSHFMVLPSKSEGFPKVISEAMNFGCVPIASNVSSIPQVIGENNGFLFDKLNPRNMAFIIEKALKISPVQFHKILETNYISAERFTYKIYIERIVKEIFKIKP